MIRFLIFILCFLAATTPSMARTTAQDGYEYYDKGDYMMAESIFLTLAHYYGDAEAMNGLGLMVTWGTISETHRFTACYWYEASARAGYSSGQYNFARCFEGNEERPYDLEKKILWLTRAAAQNHRSAQIALMLLYLNEDTEKAKEWGQRAIDQGSIFARVALWDNNIPYQGPSPSLFSIACVYLMNVVLDKHAGYCE